MENTNEPLTALDPSQLINLSIVVPLVGAILVVATGKSPNLRETITIATAVILFTLVRALPKMYSTTLK